MPSEIRQLGQLETLEVSLVPRGANKKRFALRKSEDEVMDEIIKAVLENDLDNEAAIDKVLKAAKMSEKAQGAIKAMLKLAAGFKDEMPADMMKMLSKLAGYDVGTPEGFAPQKKSDELDALPPEVRAKVEALWKANDEQRKENEKLQAVIKAERDERVGKEFVAKAAADFAHLPGAKAEDLGPVLKALSESSPEAYAKIELTLKAADEALKQSALLTQAGHASTHDSLSGGAWDKIVQLADSIVQKSDKGTTKAQAIDEVMRSAQGKALYQEYLAEHPAQTGTRR